MIVSVGGLILVEQLGLSAQSTIVVCQCLRNGIIVMWESCEGQMTRRRLSRDLANAR